MTNLSRSVAADEWEPRPPSHAHIPSVSTIANDYEHVHEHDHMMMGMGPEPITHKKCIKLTDVHKIASCE